MFTATITKITITITIHLININIIAITSPITPDTLKANSGVDNRHQLSCREATKMPMIAAIAI